MNSVIASHFTKPAISANRSESPDGRIAHVLWDFGEGAPSTQPEGNHTYSRAGTIRVTLIVWDNHGRGAIAEQPVTVRPASSKRWNSSEWRDRSDEPQRLKQAHGQKERLV